MKSIVYKVESCTLWQFDGFEDDLVIYCCK